MKDFRGQEVSVGDTIVYIQTRGSKSYLKEEVVEKILPSGFKICGYRMVKPDRACLIKKMSAEYLPQTSK